jgi:hypothetical protein
VLLEKVREHLVDSAPTFCVHALNNAPLAADSICEDQSISADSKPVIICQRSFSLAKRAVDGEAAE